MSAQRHSQRISVRRVPRSDGGDMPEFSVFCRRVLARVRLQECYECPHCDGLGIDASDNEPFVRCNYEGERAPSRETPPRPAAGAEREPNRVPVSDVMTAPVRCATPETSIAELTRLLLEQGISAVPVVDAAGKPIGMISKTDLLRRYYDEGETNEVGTPLKFHTNEGYEVELGAGFHAERLADVTVDEAMTPFVLSVPQEIPVSRAAAIMAYEGVHRVAVTTPEGKVVGVASSLDILRWLALRDGYAVPPRSHPDKAS